MMVLWPLNLMLSAGERGKQLVRLPTVMVPLIELGDEVMDSEYRILPYVSLQDGFQACVGHPASILAIFFLRKHTDVVGVCFGGPFWNDQEVTN